MKKSLIEKKGVKTTIVAILSLLIYLSNNILFMIQLYDKTVFDAINQSLYIFVPVLIGFLSKDYNKSHSIKNNEEL